ncbi:malonate decarboxylase subunit alpha [Pseudomonas syringae]|uniref:malonate decarboxylase subunit alpha n=3 Tax=Pseudomonas syringae TaxID=317 RepID=UPI000E324CE7|nr:malonate decarboxylase subunit alpha [Pseudomonas syringae]
MTTTTSPDARWTRRRSEKQRRLEQVRALADGVVLPTDNIVAALEALLVSGDRVVLEGNNQKQADFLSRALAKVDPGKVHDLHMIMPSVGRAEHLDLFEQGIARKLDFSFAGTQSLRISQLLEDGLLEIGAIHTYIELYSRLVVDLIPNVVLAAGFMADRAGNIYTGPSTEDTPALIEPAAFSDGIVIVQVNQLVDDVSELPRVDIPASWVDFVVVADKPFYIEPLFTRDPRHIKPVHVLMAMMAIRGIYEKHNVQSLNHGIGFNTAAIELILPTYGESLGLKGKICRNWTLNPHPTLIPADRLIANVNGVMNAVMVNGDASGSTLFYGAGAGMEPTASSVVADLVDVVRAMTSDPENRVPHLAFQPDSLSAHPILPIEACESAYYLRIQAKDHPGVLAQVASILSERGINIESIMQKDVEEHDGLVPMILLTHRVVEQRINDAIQALEALQDVVGPVVRIRVEHLN